MDQEQWTEWFTIRDEAIRRLKSAEWELRVSMFPSFGNAHSLGIMMQGNQTRGLHQVWRYDLAVEKFRTPIERMKHPKTLQPTFEQFSEPINADVLQRLLELLNKSLPRTLPPMTFAGCDGTRYEIEAGTHMHKLTFEWWERGPQEWQDLLEYTQSAWHVLTSEMSNDPLPKPQTFL